MADLRLRDRVLANAYDWLMTPLENALLRDVRAELIAGVTGDVLEIGGGTGANLSAYPDGLHSLEIVEPDLAMAEHMKAKLSKAHHLPETAVTEASAERLPFAAASFDSVVGTLMLCSVPDPDHAIREIGRVLRPAGRFYFIEHVRSKRAGLGRFQDIAEAPWTLACQCHPNRDTATLLRNNGFDVDLHVWQELPPKAGLIRDFIWGTAEAA